MEKKQRGNPNWVKGRSGNPVGRKPGKTPIEELIGALNRKGVREKMGWLDRVVEMAWDDGRVMSAVLKKIIADKQAIDHTLQGDLIIKLVQFAEKNGNNPSK